MISGSRKFNWQGIEDNGDGSFNAEDKRARRRLTKEFHRQGFTVRSVKISGDGYKVTPVGEGHFKVARMGRAPTVRQPYRSHYRRSGPGLRRYPVMARRAYPMRRAAPPIARGPSTFAVAGRKLAEYQRNKRIRLQKEQTERLAAKKTEQEITEKMRAERISQERQETVRQLERQRLERESHGIREESITMPPKHREEKPDTAQLQEARQNYIEKSA